MHTTNKRFDAYIAKSAEFAKPILLHLRELVHETCPGAEEKIKWGHLHFDYKGMMCGMAAFKQHAVFGFWKAPLMNDPQRLLGESQQAMGHFGRLTKLSDLPSDKILKGFIRQAMALNDAGATVNYAKRRNRPPLPTPPWFRAALQKNKKAAAVYDAFSPSQRREYIEWLQDAKTDETRKRRLETALEWIAEGKIRNWKYVKK